MFSEVFEASNPEPARSPEAMPPAILAPIAVDGVEAGTGAGKYGVRGLSLAAIGTLPDGSELMAPRYNGGRVLLDCGDEWGEIMACSDGLLNLHRGIGTRSFVVDLRISSIVAPKIRIMDKAVQYMFMNKDKAERINWAPIYEHGDETNVLQCGIVVAGSKGMTQLHVLDGEGRLQSGVGETFLKSHFPDSDSMVGCRVRSMLELSCIEENSDLHQAKVVVKAHSLFFARPVSTTVAAFSEEAIASFTSSAKRMRVEEL